MQPLILGAALLFLLPNAQSTSLYNVLFPNDIGFHTFTRGIWATLGGTDQQDLPLTSASAAFENAQNLGILPPNTNIDVSKLDTNNDGFLNQDEVFNFMDASMKALDVRDINSTFANSVDASNLKAVHQNIQQSICDTVDPSQNLTVDEARLCLHTQTCQKFMPCGAQGVAIHRRGFFEDVQAAVYQIVVVVVALFIIQIMWAIMYVVISLSLVFIFAMVLVTP